MQNLINICYIGWFIILTSCIFDGFEKQQHLNWVAPNTLSLTQCSFNRSRKLHKFKSAFESNMYVLKLWYFLIPGREIAIRLFNWWDVFLLFMLRSFHYWAEKEKLKSNKSINSESETHCQISFGKLYWLKRVLKTCYEKENNSDIFA